MDYAAAITGAIVGAGVGIALDWNRQWTVGIFSRREIRAAVGAELHGVLVTLNFFIFDAIDDPDRQRQKVTGYFDGLRLDSVDFYWQQEREKLLKLPEWPRLKRWNDRLAQLGSHQEPLFEAIMLFESLLIPPLDKCLSHSSKQFARSVVARPDVVAIKMTRLFPKNDL
jgi:hypothetical protein